MQASKVLYLITDDFPIGGKEPYLVEELPQLKKVFQEIIFVTTLPGLRSSMEAGKHIHISFPDSLANKLSGFLGIFHSSVNTEILNLIRNRELSFYKVKLLLSYFQRAKRIRQEILKHSSKFHQGEHLTFYSYWCDERALAVSLLKQKKFSTGISRAHGWDIYSERNPENYLPFRPWLLKNLDILVCISENGKKYLEQKYGQLGKDKTEIHRLGSSRLNKIPTKQGDQPFILLSIAYAVPLKRLGKIIEALNFSQNEKIKWIHLGGGPEIDNLIQLNKRLNENKLNIQTEFWGNVSHEHILNFLENNYVDLFVNVSETEGLPVSIMEAMSAQIPCIATDVGGSGEIVNSSNGYLVPVGISNESLWKLIQNHYNLGHEQYVQMRNQAYGTWKEKYSSEKNYFSFAERLNSLNLN